jgi:hypothetical protein
MAARVRGLGIVEAGERDVEELQLVAERELAPGPRRSSRCFSEPARSTRSPERSPGRQLAERDQDLVGGDSLSEAQLLEYNTCARHISLQSEPISRFGTHAKASVLTLAATWHSKNANKQIRSG